MSIYPFSLLLSRSRSCYICPVLEECVSDLFDFFCGIAEILFGLFQSRSNHPALRIPSLFSTTRIMITLFFELCSRRLAHMSQAPGTYFPGGWNIFPSRLEQYFLGAGIAFLYAEFIFLSLCNDDIVKIYLSKYKISFIFVQIKSQSSSNAEI